MGTKKIKVTTKAGKGKATLAKSPLELIIKRKQWKLKNKERRKTIESPKESRSAARAGKGVTAKEKAEVKMQKEIRKIRRKYHTQKR